MLSAITISGIDYEVTDKTRKYVSEKIGRLDKYVPPKARASMAADVKLRQINEAHGNKYEVDITIQIPDKTINAKDSTLNIMAAVDIVEEKLERQLRRYKETLLQTRDETAQ